MWRDLGDYSLLFGAAEHHHGQRDTLPDLPGALQPSTLRDEPGLLTLGLETTEWSPMMNLELAERRAVETKQPVVVVSAA